MPDMTTPSQALRGRTSYDPFKNPSDIRSEKIGRVLMQGFSPTQRGLTLVKRGGEWEALDSVTHDELEAAELYYLGGHTHEVTLAIGRELVDAGMVTETLDDPITDAITDELGRVIFEGIPDWRPSEG